MLRLKDPVCGIREGCVAFIGHEGSRFQVCRLGENDSGELCQTDALFDISVDFADGFTPAMSMGRI